MKADFTEAIFLIAKKNTKVNHITTDMYPTPAERPAYSVLDNKAFRDRLGYEFADWKTAIEEYLK